MPKIEFKNSIIQYKKAVKKLPTNDAVRAICAQEVIRAYQFLEIVFWELECDPMPLLTSEIQRLTSSFEGISSHYNEKFYSQRVMHRDNSKSRIANSRAKLDVKEVTGRLYSSLFTKFDAASYFNEATDLLKERIERNDVGFEWFKGKKGLDAGCGGGRYTVALSQLGAKKMTGIDYGKDNIADAKSRIKKAKVDGVNFRRCDVLEIPYKNSTFDFAFSNGVLHHTTDPQKGLEELYRVIKPKGTLWIFLYGKSLWWEMMELLRLVSLKVPRELTQNLMQLMGYAPNRIFKFLDSLHVPIIESYSAIEMKSMLRKAGFTDLVQLNRGVRTQFFRGVNEILKDGGPYAKTRWGAGELRFIAKK